MREPPHATVETYTIMLEHCHRLGARFERFGLVADLSDVTERPKGSYLAAIRRSFDSACVHTAVTQPGRPFLRTVLRFVMGRMSAKTSVHASVESACEAVRELVR
jgi:hypothetical protein